MKKFAIIETVGSWNNNMIDCTVEETNLKADMNTYEEAKEWMNNKGKTEYKPNGKWYSYSIEPRKWAKMKLGL